jgi:hypothetical protein
MGCSLVALELLIHLTHGGMQNSPFISSLVVTIESMSAIQTFCNEENWKDRGSLFLADQDTKLKV